MLFYCYIEYNIVSTTTKFQLGKNSSLKNFHRLPSKIKIFYHENAHMKNSNDEFFPNYSIYFHLLQLTKVIANFCFFSFSDFAQSCSKELLAYFTMF